MEGKNFKSLEIQFFGGDHVNYTFIDKWSKVQVTFG